MNCRNRRVSVEWRAQGKTEIFTKTMYPITGRKRYQTYSNYTSKCLLAHRIWPLVTFTCSQTAKRRSQKWDLDRTKRLSEETDAYLAIKDRSFYKRGMRKFQSIEMDCSALVENYVYE